MNHIDINKLCWLLLIGILFFEDVAFAHVKTSAFMFASAIVLFQVFFPIIYGIIVGSSLVRFAKITVIYSFCLLLIYNLIYYGILSNISPGEDVGNIILIVIHIVLPAISVHLLFSKIRN